jgi:hypothetical protein
VDQLLVCHTAALQHRAIDLVRGAVESGRIPAARLEEAKARVARLLRFAGPPPDPYTASARLRTVENLALAARVPRLATGRDPTARQPFEVEPHASGFAPGVDPERLNQLADQLQAEETAKKAGGRG